MSIITAGRNFHANHVLRDTCTITRLGEPAFNSSTGLYATPVTTVATSLPCHMAPFTGARSLDEEFGGEIVVTRNYALKLPWNHVDIRREDIVTMVSSADPGMVGRVFRVDQVDGETFQMSRKVICEAIAGEPEQDESSSDGSSGGSSVGDSSSSSEESS